MWHTVRSPAQHLHLIACTRLKDFPHSQTRGLSCITAGHTPSMCRRDDTTSPSPKRQVEVPGKASDHAPAVTSATAFTCLQLSEESPLFNCCYRHTARSASTECANPGNPFSTTVSVNTKSTPPKAAADMNGSTTTSNSVHISASLSPEAPLKDQSAQNPPHCTVHESSSSKVCCITGRNVIVRHEVHTQAT